MARNVYATKFVVKGAGRFPVDMLRYDTCYPHQPEDAAAILDKEMRKVELVTLMNGEPTRARWESFGWMVTVVFPKIQVNN